MIFKQIHIIFIYYHRETGGGVVITPSRGWGGEGELGGEGVVGFTHVPSLNFKTCCFLYWGGSHVAVDILLLYFALFSVAIAVLSRLHVICHHFICPVPVSRPCLSSGVVVRFIFIYYLMFCSVPRVRKLLKAGVNVNASDGATSDNKALHWAVSYGNADIVKLLCGRFIFYIFQNMSSLRV